MITYQVEKFLDVEEEIKPLIHAHYMEIANDKAIKPLDVNWQRYEELETINCLHIMTARLEPEQLYTIEGGEVRPKARGFLIGYFVSFVMPHLHYQQTTYAMNDIFYVTPEHRNGLVGYKLMKQATYDLKNIGADILTMHMKVDYPFRNILTRQGFTLTEENWEKVL